MDGDEVYEVCIRHNLVQSVRRLPRSPDMVVCDSRLEVSCRLAANHQENGCLDGRYLLIDAEHARSFALLALDFVKRLVERRAGELEAMDTGGEYPPPRGTDH